MTQTIEAELREQLNQLPPEEQRKVLEFARSLVSTKTHGTPGKNLLRFAGNIAEDDLKIMQEAIEENCERIDLNEW